MSVSTIYVLIDPRDNEIRYVGKTNQKLRSRLLKHLRDKNRGHRHNWIAKLQRFGLQPRIEKLQEVPCGCSASAEIYWIAYFRSLGCNLVNDTDGGEGMCGYKHTPEQIERIRQNTIRQFQDPEQRLNVSRVHKGKEISQSHREVVSRASSKRWNEWRMNGKRLSQEVRDKISIAKSGKGPLSDEHKKKLSATLRGRPKSESHRENLAKHLRSVRMEQVLKIQNGKGCRDGVHSYFDADKGYIAVLFSDGVEIARTGPDVICDTRWKAKSLLERRVAVA